MTKPNKRQTCLAVLLAFSLLAGWRCLIDTFTLSWGNDEYTHILLIIPVSAALIFLSWHSLRTKFNWVLRLAQLSCWLRS